LLAVQERGTGEPLVLIHGLATTHEIWDLVIPTLSERRRVVSLDVPGFGDSAPVGEGFELAAVAERVARGLAARGVPTPFDLVGHSLGAGIALTLAASRPRAVRRLILVAPAGLVGMPSLVSRVLAASVDGMLAARRGLAPLVDLDWGRRLLLGFAAADGAAIPPGQARLMLGASAHAKRTAAALLVISGADLRPLLADLRVPLGVIWGVQDRTVPARVARRVLRARPDADMVMLERAGHVPMIERPDAFVDALEGLLARLPKHATSSPGTPSTLR
jgi:pimeloyl-ACP methyl ester carboxylesterase